MQLVTIFVVLIVVYAYTLAFLSTRVGTRSDHGSDGLFFVLLVPALNEERVIGKTLTSLLALRGDFLVVVIDDASDDGTVAAIAPFLIDPRVRVLQQPPERARRGKGHALNAGYAAVQNLGLAQRYGPENLVMVVFDSDTRVEPDFLQAVGPYFRDPKVGGVQSAIRMYNAERNLLTLWQHLEFAIWGQLFSRAKNLLGSATLGGNGQCVRFSALAGLGAEPWQPFSLTEDLDLSLRLLMKGQQLRFCPSVAAWQEAVPRVRALVRQRTRWLQGHVACWRYLPALLSGKLPLGARVDLLLFLLLPVMFLPIGLVSVVSWAYFLSLEFWNPAGLLAWYVLGFPMVPLVVAAWRRIDRPPWPRLLLHAHLFVFYGFVWFLAGMIVYWHVIVGRRGWAKTSRAAPGPADAAQRRSDEKEPAYPAPYQRPVGSPVVPFEPAPEDAGDRSGTRRGAAKVVHDPDNAPAVGPGRGLPEKGPDSAEKVEAGGGAAGREELPAIPPVVASLSARDCALNASLFQAAVARHWGVELNYEVQELPLLEQLLLAALREKPGVVGRPPVSNAFVRCLGCYVGETLRRHATRRGSWHEAEDWGTDAVLEFPGFVTDPIGFARFFLEEGSYGNMLYFVSYVLGELNRVTAWRTAREKKLADDGSRVRPRRPVDADEVG